MKKLLLLGLIVASQTLLALDYKGQPLKHVRIPYDFKVKIQDQIDQISGEVYEIVIPKQYGDIIDVFYIDKIKNESSSDGITIIKDNDWIDDGVNPEDLSAEEIISRYDKEEK